MDGCGSRAEKESLIGECLRVFEECPGNRVTVTDGQGTEREIDLFCSPSVAFAAADDPLFERFKDESVIGPDFRTPGEWLEGAGSVISLFFPFTETVRESNRRATEIPSVEWLYGRVEGQAFIVRYMEELKKRLEARGLRVHVPGVTMDYGMTKKEVVGADGEPDFRAETLWSERHAAFAAGLGTFGLSRGLITARGMAGRFASAIIDLRVEPDRREYSEVYEYCIRCGKCARRCPGGAISLSYGKSNRKCQEYQRSIRDRLEPRFGCGMCQTGVPCECGIPGRKGK